MKRNREEHELWTHFQSMMASGTYEPVDLMNMMNKEFGYNMFQIQKNNGIDEIVRMKDVIMGNPEEDLPFAFEMTYEEFGKRYTFKTSTKTWKRRKKDVEKTVVRLYMGYPGTQYFYLRKLLRSKRMQNIFHPDDLLKHPDTGDMYLL